MRNVEMDTVLRCLLIKIKELLDLVKAFYYHSDSIIKMDFSK